MAESSSRILVVNGPNLNLLGTREPGLYGSETLQDVEALCTSAAASLGYDVGCVQSNHEAHWWTRSRGPRHRPGDHHQPRGLYAHLGGHRRRLRAVALPVIEVHISNVHAREEFRRHSYVSPVADAVIAGAGIDGYRFAVERLARLLEG